MIAQECQRHMIEVSKCMGVSIYIYRHVNGNSCVCSYAVHVATLNVQKLIMLYNAGVLY